MAAFIFWYLDGTEVSDDPCSAMSVLNTERAVISGTTVTVYYESKYGADTYEKYDYGVELDSATVNYDGDTSGGTFHVYAISKQGGAKR